MNIKNEQFREYCYIGDLGLVKSFYGQERPDVNSKNKMNGWTVLHWAAKQNHLKIVEFLLSVGADYEIRNDKGQVPAELTVNNDIRKLLNFEAIAESLLVEAENSPQLKKRFIPNFKKNPDFHYANKSMFNEVTPMTLETSEEKPLASKETPEKDIIQAKKAEAVSSLLPRALDDSNIITIKVRAHGEEDFVEMDIDKSMSFEEFKIACVKELDDLIDQDLSVFKVRKLPNVLVRNSNDVKRLKNDQEIELVFHKRGI